MRIDTRIGLLVMLGLVACEIGPKDIGQLDGDEDGSGTEDESTGDGDGESTGDGDDTLDSGDGDCEPAQPLTLDFAITGLAPGEDDVTLTCAANAVPDGEDILVSFTLCTDQDDQPHADLELTLSGDWWEPSLGDGDLPATTLRYVQQPAGEHMNRWLALETEGQFPLALAAIDASTLYPPDVLDFDYGPVDISFDQGSCTHPEHPSGCGPVDRLEVLFKYGSEFTGVIDGSSIHALGSLSQGGSVYFDVVVARAWELLENSCFDVPERELVIGLVAYPNS